MSQRLELRKGGWKGVGWGGVTWVAGEEDLGFRIFRLQGGRHLKGLGWEGKNSMGWDLSVGGVLDKIY